MGGGKEREVGGTRRRVWEGKQEAMEEEKGREVGGEGGDKGREAGGDGEGKEMREMLWYG